MAGAEYDPDSPLMPTKSLLNAESGSERSDEAHAREQSGAVLAGRFELRRLLGEGSSGRIYEAFDRDAQKSVAVKVLRRLGPRAIARLKQEARELAGFSHPNLVTVYDLVAHAGDWLFSMEYVDGVPFDVAVHGPASERLPRLSKLVPQLVAGICAMHARGRVHRDLKPANVLVTPGDRVVIVDFGLVRESLVADTELGFAGTPAYAAPEQMLGQAAGPHSDWYAVGVMLYQALTGSLPYRGTLHEMLREKLDRAARAHEHTFPELPCELAELCSGLLAPEPAQRLDGAAILRAFSAAPLPEVAELEPAPLLIGRQHELLILRSAFADALGQRPSSVVIHGPSGIGKSQLARAFIADLEHSNAALVLVARSNPNEQLPFQTLDAVVDGIARYLRKLPLATAAGLLNPEVHSLAQLFPTLTQLAALSEVPPPARADLRDDATRRQAAARGLGMLLTSVSSRVPVALAFEDVHDSDPDSDELLASVMRHLEGRVLVLATSRHEHVRALFHPAPRQIALGPLSIEVTEELVRCTLGPHVLASVCGGIAAESGGNPLHAHELAMGVGNAGISLTDALARRIDLLSESERALVRAVALARTPLDREILLLSVKAGELIDLARLTRARVLRAGKGKTGKVLYEPYHQPLAEAALAGLSAEERALLHGRLGAAYLERGTPSDVAAAVNHLLGAGRNEDAAEHAASSAEEASRTFAFHRAADLLAIALEHMREGPRRAQLEQLARSIFSAAGRFRDAARSYAQAASVAPPEERFDLERQAMENDFFAGDYTKGFDRLVKLSREVGVWIPRSRLGLWIAVLMRGFYYMIVGIPRLAERPAAGVARRRAELTWSATAVQNNDMLTWVFTVMLALAQAARAGLRDQYLVLQVAWVAGFRGIMKRARPGDAELIAQAEARASESPFETWLHIACGIYHYYAGSLGRASDAFERATQARGSASLAGAQRFGRAALLSCWFHQGELGKLAQYAPEWAEEAMRADDAHLGPRLRILAAMSYLDRDPEQARAELALIRANDRSARPVLSTDHWWEVWVALYAGQLEHAYQVARRLSYRRPMDMPSSHYVLSLTARGHAVAATMTEFPGRARELARVIRRLKKSPHAWAPAFSELLIGTEYAAQGRPSASSEALERAERAFEAIGMFGHLAAVRVRRGELLGGELGRLLSAQGREELRRLGCQDVERWLCLLAPGFPSGVPHT